MDQDDQEVLDDHEVLDVCHPDEIVDAIGQLHGLANAARYQLMRMCVAYDARELWRQDGANSMAEWLCMRLSWSLRSARELVEIAHSLQSLPAIAAAYEAGILSFDQVRILVRFVTPESDKTWAQKVWEMSLPQLEAWARRAREIKPEETAENHRRRSLRWRWNFDESWLAIRGRLPADQGAVVVKALERVAAQAPPLPSGVYEDFESRAADALVELAGVTIGKDSDADRTTVVVHVDHDVLVGNEGVAEIEGGVALDPEVARRLHCDARIKVMAHGEDGRGFGIGRTSRTAPPWLHRVVKRRDRGCRFPGCNRTIGVAAHHLDCWVRDEGPTDDDNLALLCRAHHRLVHEGKWSIRGHPAGVLTFIRPDGREFEPGPPALRPEIRDRLLPGPDG